MSTVSRLIAVLFVCLAASSIGCNKEANAPTPADDAAKKAAKEQPAAGASGEVDSAVEAELAKLTPAERELVVVQKYCPVTSELLGSMGPPIKVSVEGRDLYICCDGCKESLEKDFAKYLAMLDKREAGDENPFD